MLTLEALSNQIQSYREGRIDCDSFEEWFRSNSWGMYDRRGDQLSNAIAAIEFAFSALDANEIDECLFRQELASAIGPFGQEVIVVSWNEEIDVIPIWKLLWIPHETR